LYEARKWTKENNYIENKKSNEKNPQKIDVKIQDSHC
jgi:hypothetical protein